MALPATQFMHSTAVSCYRRANVRCNETLFIRCRSRLTATTSQLVGISPWQAQGTYKNKHGPSGVGPRCAVSPSRGRTMSFNGTFESVGHQQSGTYSSVYVGCTGSGLQQIQLPSDLLNKRDRRHNANYVDNILERARQNASGSATNYTIALSGLSGVCHFSNYNDLFANGVGGCVGNGTRCH